MTDGGRIDEAVLALRGLARGPARWIWDHWPKLAEARSLGGRPDWQHLAATMTKDGVRTTNGKGPKSETVRHAFLRVAREVELHGYPGSPPPPPNPPVVRRPPRPIPLAEPATPRKLGWQDEI